jgi:hypothetical protein
MPLAVESLTKDSPIQDIRDAISESIEKCVKEGGRDQKQCAAIAYSIARKKTGRSLDGKTT